MTQNAQNESNNQMAALQDAQSQYAVSEETPYEEGEYAEEVATAPQRFEQTYGEPHVQYETEPDHDEEEQEAAAPQYTQQPNKRGNMQPDLHAAMSQAQRARYHSEAKAYQLGSENSQLNSALAQLREENSRLSQLAHSSTQTAVQQFEQAALQRFEAAKSNYARALENGDIQEQTAATAALSIASAEYNNATSLKAREALVNQPPVAQQPQPNYAHQQEYVQQQAIQQHRALQQNNMQIWTSQNDWMVQNSKNFDADLAREVDGYATQFEQNLRQNGLEHAIATPEYFEVINSHVQALKSGRGTSNPRGLNMNTPLSRMGNGRRGPTQGANSNLPPLTKDQRDIARAFEMSDDQYKRSLARDKKYNAAQRAGHNPITKIYYDGDTR